MLLWILQIGFLKIFYERYQERTITKIANNIQKYESEASLDTYLEQVAYKNNVCIQRIYENGTQNFNVKMNGCMVTSTSFMITTEKKKLFNSKNNIDAVRFVNPDNEVKSLLYGIRRDKSYIYVNSSLEDLNATSGLLRGQLIYITFIAIIFAILISYFLSKKITKPIVSLTEKVEKIGTGTVNFEKNGITEIDELADTLQYVDGELYKADELRRDLMANVSHDLKTPLTMIKAYAEMVRDISYRDKKKREEHLNVIIDEADRLNILVNDILELSKMQADADTLHLEEYDLAIEIREILKRYEIIKETEDYDLELSIPEHMIVKADKNKLNQVIYNLINNAINYTGDDKKVYITVTENKSDYLVEIRDTGKGIDAEEVKHIWNKYYKNDKNHKRNVVGTGLGLSIVKQILLAHHFDYGVHSKKNEGTCFFFRVKKCQKKKKN